MGFAWLIIFGSMIGCRTAPHFGNEQIKAKRSAKNGVELTLTLTYPMRANVPAPLDITLANKNTAEVNYCRNKGFLKCNVHVTNALEVKMPFTQYGREAISLPEGYDQYTHHRFFESLASGQKKTWSIDLLRCFNLPPGSYVLSVSVVMDELGQKPFSLEVAEVKFSVE